MLIFKPVPLLALLKRSFFNCSCLLVLDNSARSSAKSRSSNFSVNLYLIPVFPSLSVFLITQSMTSMKRKPDITHPCQSNTILCRTSQSYLPHQILHICFLCTLLEPFLPKKNQTPKYKENRKVTVVSETMEGTCAWYNFTILVLNKVHVVQ